VVIPPCIYMLHFCHQSWMTFTKKMTRQIDETYRG
jgi:hypothetical protein